MQSYLWISANSLSTPDFPRREWPAVSGLSTCVRDPLHVNQKTPTPSSSNFLRTAFSCAVHCCYSNFLLSRLRVEPTRTMGTPMKTVFTAAIIVAVSLFAAPQVNAARQAYVSYTYYSDASHTTQVGFDEFYCPAGSSSTGIHTPYKVQVIETCSDAAVGTPPYNPQPGVPLPAPPTYLSCHIAFDGDTYYYWCEPIT